MKYDEHQNERPTTINNGFWDRDPQDRAARYDRATQNGELGSFWDLTPEERAKAYED